MEVINYINISDKRCIGVEFILSPNSLQYESHGRSYYDMREWLKKSNVMGFDRKYGKRKLEVHVSGAVL